MNDAQIAILAAELTTSTHPSTPVYDADPHAAAAELNALNIEGEATPEEVLQYFVENQHRENTGSDTQNTNLYGRVKMVAESAPGGDPFGVTDSLTVGQIAAAKTVLRMLDGDGYNVSLANSDVDGALTKCQGANCYSSAQKTAIVALSDNKRSHAQALGLPRVKAGNVRQARGETY